ncbi:hypothetical protein [Pseudomonas sp. PA15(2017)]|uniref:hypothetical protein n=1 Tax=Pseudomonas sp. PA15(2017) TaxID=1932111 RepID=UPI001439F93C|nr:hypothetical protein [Pseudomonas sp. PA15(2017)]
MTLLLLHTHCCRHCGSHSQLSIQALASGEDLPACPICFTTELDELEECGDEQ